MPLDPHCGSRARGRNVATLIHEDRPPRQAVAIAYATQRRAVCPLSTPPGHPVQTHRPLVTFDLYAKGQRVGTVSTSLGYTAAHVEASESAARGYPVTARKRSAPKARNRTRGSAMPSTVSRADFDHLVAHLRDTGWHGESAMREAYKRTGRPVTITLERVRLNGGGYSRDGHYFGRGAPLYAFSDDESAFNDHVRAPTAAAARQTIQAKWPQVAFLFKGARK